MTHSLSRRRNEECLECPGLDGKAGPCDHFKYSRKYVRFMLAHQEAFLAAYVDGNAQASANELERLSREYRTLPPRHVCSCQKLHPKFGWQWDCTECKRLDDQRPKGSDVAITIGRTTPVHAPMPSVACLDLMAGYAA